MRWWSRCRGPRVPDRIAAHRLGEGVAAHAIVGEHVHGRAGRGKQDDVTGLSQVAGASHHEIHDPSVSAGKVDHRDIRCVSRQRPGNLRTVGPDQNHPPKSIANRLDQPVHVSTLEQTARDPDDVLEKP